jgi:hypothetical protein
MIRHSTTPGYIGGVLSGHIEPKPAPHPFKEWSGGGPVRPYCASCGRQRNDPLHADGVPTKEGQCK